MTLNVPLPGFRYQFSCKILGQPRNLQQKMKLIYDFYYISYAYTRAFCKIQKSLEMVDIFEKKVIFPFFLKCLLPVIIIKNYILSKARV